MFLNIDTILIQLGDYEFFFPIRIELPIENKKKKCDIEIVV